MDNVDTLRRLLAQNLPFFSALSDPIRQQLVVLMMDGSRKSVAELAAQTELSRPTISHHLKILRDAHIITSQKVGRKRYYSPEMRNSLKLLRELTDATDTH